jgi:SAM-dependent methyltransferase
MQPAFFAGSDRTCLSERASQRALGSSCGLAAWTRRKETEYAMTTTSGGAAAAEYLLGHDREELARLEHQAAALAPHTKVILERAGLGSGMRVLDVGSGVGDVAFIAAELVGPTGTVVGIDRSEAALARARERAAERGLDNIEFHRGDLQDWQPVGSFDAAVGRLVLLYVDDPVAAVGRVASLVRPDGVVAFMEYDMAAVESVPTAAIVDQVREWVCAGFAKTGHDPRLGIRLGGILDAAGLAEARAIALRDYLPPTSPVVPAMAAGVIRTLLPAIEAHGIATAAEVDIETLEARIGDELRARRAYVSPPALIGGWARVNGRS